MLLEINNLSMEKNKSESNTMSPAISTAETVQMDSSTKSSDLLVFYYFFWYQLMFCIYDNMWKFCTS